MRRKRQWVFSMVLVVAALLGAKKIFDYAAAPDKPKESDFVFPANPDQEKPTVQVLDSVPSSINFQLNPSNRAMRKD